MFLIVGILLRFLCLGDRPLHHDESIHAIFGYDWFVAPATKFYQYDPRFHGPVLYEMLRFTFAMLGVGAIQARLVVAVAGCLVFLSPLLFRRWLGNTATLVAVGLLATSPLHAYYSRFLAHDEIAILFATLTLYGFLRYREEKVNRRALTWIGVSAVCAGITFAIKATAFLYAFIFIGFGLLWWGYGRWERRSFKIPSVWFGKSLGIFLGSFFVAYAFFQTSFFQNWPGFANGLYREVFQYWWGQHAVERLYAPLNYHLRSLLLHELPILLGITVGWAICFRRLRYCRISFLVVVIAAFLLLPLTREVYPREGVLALFKARSLSDLFPYLFAFGLGAPGTIAAIQKRNWPLALVTYWCFASIAIYSYAGEKVPWLTVHIVYPAALFCGYVFSYLYKWLQENPSSKWRAARPAIVVFFVLLGLYQMRLAYFVSYVTAGEPVDLLSQVHTHRNVKDVMEWLHRYSIETGQQPNKIRVGLFGKMPTWSFLFYLVSGRYQNVVFEPNEINGKESFLIMNDDFSKQLGTTLRKRGYEVTELINAGTWVPEKNLSWSKWVDYAIHRVASGSYTGEALYVYHRPK